MTENTMGTAKVWKQADNQVKLTGFVAENNLEIKEFDEYKDGAPTGNKYSAMTGSLSVKVAENETHQVRFFSKQFTNAGAASRQFTGLQTVADTVVSIADTEKNPELKPSKINIQGSMGLNEYVGQDEQLRSFSSIEGRFVNRLEEGDTSECQAQFDLEGLVGKVVDEIKGDEETGRKKVTLLVPLYNSVIPLEFTVDAGAGADYIGDNFENGKSVRVYGDIVNFRQDTEKEVEMGFGANKIETVTKFVNENSIKGGSLYDEDVHTSKIIDTGLVKEKLVQREKYLENMKTKAKQRQQGGNDKPKNGFGGGFGGTTNTAPKKSEVPDEILKGLF